MDNNRNSSGNGACHKFFKNLDFFSITFQFRIGKRPKFASFCGGLSFFFYILLILAYVLKSFLDYITFEDKKIQFIEKFDRQANLTINSDNFFYSFKFTYLDRNLGLKAKERNVIGSEYEKYFTLERNFIKVEGENEIKVYEGKAELKQSRNCSHVNIFDFVEENMVAEEEAKEEAENAYFKSQNITFNNNSNLDSSKYVKKSHNINITDHLCFDYPEMNFYGQYTDSDMGYMEIVLRLNATLVKSKPEEVENVFENVLFKFALYNSDNIYDVSNHEKPVTKSVESKVFSYIDIYSYEKKSIFFQELVFAQDNNLLTKSPNPHTLLTMSYYEKETLPMLNRFSLTKDFKDKMNLLKFFFRVDIKKTVVTVALIKIPEFLSGVGAIVSNLLLILNLIVSYFNNFHAKQKIIRKMMKYGDDIKEYNKEDIRFFISNFNFVKNSQNEKSKAFKSLYNNSYIYKKTTQQLNDSMDLTALGAEANKNNLCLEKNMNFGANKNHNMNEPNIDVTNNNTYYDVDNNNVINYSEKQNQQNLEMSDRSNNLLNASEFNNKVNNLMIDDNNCNNSNKNHCNKNRKDMNSGNYTISPKRNSDENMNISKEFQTTTINKLRDFGLGSKNNSNTNTTNNNNNIINKEHRELPISIESKSKTYLKEAATHKNEKSFKILPNSKFKNQRRNLNKKKPEIYISSWELIERMLCCKAAIKPKLNVFRKAENTINSNMDILNYFKRMQEIDILKYLILDENLLEVMNFISKPCILNRSSQRKLSDEEIDSFFNANGNENTGYYCMERLKQAFNKIVIGDYEKNSIVKNRILRIFEHQMNELL